MEEQNFWKIKLAAWLHDPAEKALILLRDREGHEHGTVKRLRDKLGYVEMDSRSKGLLKKGDWYASAADRPQFPKKASDGRYASWTQVDFSSKPVLKHPLTGEELNLKRLELDVSETKSISFDHFEQLIVLDESEKVDYRKTYLNFWRFGPQTPAEELNHLWQALPADTRVPDHTIWQHLDIVSAFTGAMSADEKSAPALLNVSFGPVQGFIAEARSTSDLWAGSHLLSRIAWEGMKVVCEKLGPDAILFPSLRAVPQVDLWLVESGLSQASFEREEWTRQNSDANPLFAAALPNKFVALVPADRGEEIAKEIEKRVRAYIEGLGERTVKRILQEIEEPDHPDLHCYAQLEKQLSGFPEVYWALVPWSLASTGAGEPDTTELKKVLSNFYQGEQCGFIDTPAWQVLQKEIELEGAQFYRPNLGTLYPALYDLLERVAAAAKTARTFKQLPQVGYRSSLNGEREWLTLDEKELFLSPGKRTKSLWARLGEKRKSWVKKGEHLDALCAIKRLWPTLFVEEVRSIANLDGLNRYVVSTHTLSMAVSLERWLEKPQEQRLERLAASLGKYEGERAALPKRIVNKSYAHSKEIQDFCFKAPLLLEEYQDNPDESNSRIADIERVLGDKIETYYAVLLFDGDNMGAWVAGNEEKYQLKYSQSWHPKIQSSIKNRFNNHPTVKEYLNTYRSASPSRHQAISSALNYFSIHVARFVVEDCFKGKLIYSGGDDVLAFVCVDDLLPAVTLLRALYSGDQIPKWVEKRLDDSIRKKLKSNKGYLQLGEKLFTMMGERATASCGALVVHHQTPLSWVMRELRKTESMAKNAGGRNALALRMLKRAGGEVKIIEKWGVGSSEEERSQALELLDRLIRFLGKKEVSRRAAYHSVAWMRELSESTKKSLVKSNLIYQMRRQAASSENKDIATDLASDLTDFIYDTMSEKEGGQASLLKRFEEFLMAGEFLAREVRGVREENESDEGEV